MADDEVDGWAPGGDEQFEGGGQEQYDLGDEGGGGWQGGNGELGMGSLARGGYDDDGGGGLGGGGGEGYDEGGPETNFDQEEDVQLPGVDDLPLFANPEARKVDLDIKAKEAAIERVVEAIADMADRVKVMREHFKNVQQEVEHTNALYNAKHAEIQTENHLKQLTSRSLGRSQLESRKLQSTLESMQDALNTVQSNIFKSNERMDEFKMQMNWNQEELEQWAVAARQKEEDNVALQKYTRADELKIKELSMQLEQFTKELVLQRAKLENEVTETQAKQMELDRIAVEFKTTHLERQDLVSRWQETINEIKKRDTEINELGERFAVAKTDRAKKEALLATQHKRLTAQQGENRDVEARSETLGRVVSRKREEMMIGTAKLQDLRDELESLKNELTTAAESLITKRANNSHLSAINEEKRVQLERERGKYQVTKQKLEGAKVSTFKAEQTAKEAEDELSQRERDFAAQIARVKLLKDKLLKESQTVYELKREEGRLKAEVVGSRSTSKNLEVQLTQLDKEAGKQQELLYNAEFQIQQIERKIARGMGERSDEEKRALKTLIDAAEERLEHAREKRKMLQGQCRKLQNELVASRNRRDSLAVQRGIMTEKQGELELENRMIEDELKRETRVKEEVVVNNDLMRLEVRRLKDLLSAKADAVFSLENRRQQLLLSMEERKQEISVHRDVLRAEMRTSNDEKHQATMDLRAREAVVEKLRARFESVARGPDEGHSQSYYIIKAAQKREEMQRRGDELDQDVRKCEREIRALQTTLDHLNARNNAYRNSFQKVDLQGDDAEVLRQLEERTKLGKDALFRKKKELQRLVTDFEEDERRLEQVKTQTARIGQQREHLMSAKQQVEEEILTQQAQLSELTDRMDKLVVRHRTKVSEHLGVNIEALEHGTLEEKSSKAEVLKDCVQNVLWTLGQLATEFPEVSDMLNSRIQEASLRMPAKPPSRGPNVQPGSSAPGSATGVNRQANSSNPSGNQRGSSRPNSRGDTLPARNFDLEI